METRTKYTLILLAIGVLVFFFKIGERDLWEPDETRYALIAREMRQGGNWIVPSLDGALYQEKPPLFFWLINLSTFFLGENTEVANRLPSALAGLFTVFVTFFFAERLFNHRVGFFSALILATCFFFPQISRWMMLDSIFCLFFLLATYYIYLGVRTPDQQRKSFLLSGLFMALGTLMKGPIGYLPIPIFLIYALINKEIRKVWNFNLLYTGLLSFGLVLLWFVPAVWITGKAYQNEMLLHQVVGRFGSGWSHPEPFYFYFIRFPLGFLPWIFFLFGAFHYGFFQISKEKGKEFLFLFVWFAFVFLFFSLSKGKKDNYLLPIYPAAAIFVGAWWTQVSGFTEGKRKIKGKLWIPIFLVTLLFLIAWLCVLFRFPKGIPRGILPYLHLAVWPLLYIILGGVLSLIFYFRGSVRYSIFYIIAALIIAQVHLSISVPSELNWDRSAKPFSRQILLRMGPDDELKIWKFRSTGLLYYTEKQIEQIKNIDRFLQIFHSPHRVFIIFEEEDFNQFKEKMEMPLNPIQRARSGHRNLLLVSNQTIQEK
jgi:4-amino-4-deoxy-L-arabinose transferase-like glycosyltransferase